MADELDLFYLIGKKGKISIKELKEVFLERDLTAQTTYYHLNKLKKRKLITIKKGTVFIVNNKESEELFNLINYCVSNNLDYHFYFSKVLKKFLSEVYYKYSFVAKDTSLNPQQFKLITDKLEKNTFLIKHRKKPFLGRILKNNFLTKLLEYHDIKPKSYLGEQITSISMNGYLRSKKKQLRTMTPINKLGFIHTSLMLEGNLLTLRETEQLLKEKISSEKNFNDVQEVINYDKALSFVEKIIHKKISLKELLEIHKLAMYNKPFAGKLREEKVIITNNPKFKIAHHKKLKNLLNDFLDELNSFKSKKLIEIIDFSARIHNQFQYIHPFIDGNSRTTRLLLFYFLQKKGINFNDIPLGFTTEYLSLTKGASKRKDYLLSQLLKEMLIQNVSK